MAYQILKGGQFSAGVCGFSLYVSLNRVSYISHNRAWVLIWEIMNIFSSLSFDWNNETIQV